MSYKLPICISCRAAFTSIFCAYRYAQQCRTVTTCRFISHRTERLKTCANMCLGPAHLWCDMNDHMGPSNRCLAADFTNSYLVIWVVHKTHNDGSCHITSVYDMCCVLRTRCVHRIPSHVMFTIRVNLRNMYFETCAYFSTMVHPINKQSTLSMLY